MTNQIVLVPQPSFQCAGDVVWTAEADGIRLVSARSTVKLLYPEAALWYFVVRGVSEARVRSMIRYIGGFADEASASAFVARNLREWQQQGLIVPDCGSDSEGVKRIV